jgi:hypothetical protein
MPKVTGFKNWCRSLQGQDPCIPFEEPKSTQQGQQGGGEHHGYYFSTPLSVVDWSSDSLSFNTIYTFNNETF